MAIAVWPTWTLAASPIGAARRPLPLTLIRARSVSSAIFTIVAGSSLPSANATVRLWLPLTTWRFVRMYPSAVRITPEPTPVVGTWNGEKRLELSPSAVMVTTDSRAAATTPVMSSVSLDDAPVLIAWPVGLVAAGAAPGSAPTSTAAVPVDARTADSMLTAMRAPKPRARRGRAVGIIGSVGPGGFTGSASAPEVIVGLYE